MQLFKTKYVFVVLHSAVCLQFQQKYFFVYIFVSHKMRILAHAEKAHNEQFFKTQ